MSKEESLSVKKALSSLDVAVIVEELRKLVVDSYVDNVYEETDGSYILKLRKHLDTILLLIKPGERLHITKHIVKLDSSGRVQLFRRFINGLKITDVTQIRFERVIKIALTGKDLQCFIYIELIPRGVMVVTDSKGKILVTTKEIKVKDREVITGRYYVFPPMFKDFRVLDANEWFNTISAFSDLARGLVRGLGIPPEVVNEVLLANSRSSKVSYDVVVKLREEIIGFISQVISNPQPVIVVSHDGKYISFLAFKPLRTYSGLRIREFTSLNEAVDEYFLRYSGLLLASQSSKEVELEIGKVTELLRRLEEELNNLRKGINDLRKIHEVVVNNYSSLEEVYECVRSTVKKYGWEHVVKCGVVSYDSSTGSFNTLINDTLLELDIKKSLKDYVIELKKRISDYEDKIKKVEEVIRDLAIKKEGLIAEKALLEAPPLSKRIDWYDKYHWIITTDGFLAIGGKDAEQNEKLVRKYLDNNDVFIHADIRGAPVFILKCGGKVSERSIYEVSVLAACYSRGWKEGLAALDVFWVFGNQVSKGPPAGEYLTQGSFMVYGRKNYIRDVKLELALGITIYDQYYKLIVGPEDYISNRCSFYAVLKPGDNSKEFIARNLLKFFTECDRRLRYLDVNELISKIPGPSSIIKHVKKT